MQLTFNNTPEQRELIAAMAHKDKYQAQAAQEIFAQLIAPTLAYIYQQADTTKFLFRDIPYEKGTDPSFPLELFSDVQDGYFSIWSSTMPGGLATNTVNQAIQEVKFQPYKLNSAWSVLSKYAKTMRLPFIAKALERIVQEILLKTNLNSWNVILSAIANARHTIGHAQGVTPSGQVFRSANPGVFGLGEYNKLMTLFRRLNASWHGGTPVGGAGKPTDFICSPEMMENFRAMAYNPINTQAANGLAITANTQQSSAASIPLPEADRAELYKSGGYPNFFGVDILELLELGKGQDYEVLFSNYIGATALPYLGLGASTGAAFAPSTDELVIVVDSTKDFAFRAEATDSDTGSVFTLIPDDQFPARAGKIGWIGEVEQAPIVLETRGCAALVV